MDILKQYLPLCWFKTNPLDLQESAGFFKQNLLFYFIVEFLMQANMTDDPIESFYEVGFETVLTMLFIAVMLLLNKSLYAFTRIATAVMFCSNVVAVFIVPVMVWLTVSEDAISYYALGLLLIWEYLQVAYIIKKVLSINTSASLVLSFFYFISTYYGAFALGQMI
ncbi:MAG: hypothetical protein ACXW0Q_02695 [Methylovulum sp.]